MSTAERETWQAVADDLASRMQYHATAAGALPSDPAAAAVYDQVAGCPHRFDEADPDCPFCEDRRAYWRYLEKRRKTRRSRR